MELRSRTLIRGLVGLNLLVFLLYLLIFRVFEVPSFTFRQWFDIDSEHNLPTYLSSVQLLLLAALSFLRSDGRGSPDGDGGHFYRVLAAGFLFLSVDEFAQIHEGITAIMGNLGLTSPFPGGFGFWILVYPVLALFAILFVWRGFLAFLAEPSGRVLFLLGGALYVGGGVLVEIGSYFFATPGEESQFFFTLVEESLESAGQLLMIAGMLRKTLGKGISLVEA